MTHFEVGQYQLPIVRTARQKSIALKPVASSHSPLQLLVPRHLSERALRGLLQRHHVWIADRLEAHLQRQQQTALWPQFAYRPQDKVIWLGECLPVVWQTQSSQSAGCMLKHETLHVPLGHAAGLLSFSAAQKAQVKRRLQSWYMQKAQAYFAQKVPDLAGQIDVSVSAIQVKTYKSRWGSCYPDGRIQFNWKLLQAPEWVVDYVIVHELCHLQHVNHSPAFWALVNQHYPQTPQAKRWLQTHGMALMAFLSD
ncbi:M48 family metallopeptidase [Thiomicrorhabdus cannonii]|uniref:M48 family metallopeptidase n=1 Tax=Thiomicrorhabdus cannonii TaxID=2748011 RepID=UPI0015BBB179|nr:SprT family zinc-dependent metalloprotease [Thiomicrorhabdus cannonii]